MVQPLCLGIEVCRVRSGMLTNFLVDLQSCEARFPDGTHLSIPRDASVAPLQLREALASAASTTVYLAVPPLRLGQSNADKDASVHGPRFWTREEDCPDENGSEAVSIEFRHPRARLLLEHDDRSDFVSLPLARIVSSTQAAGPPQIAPAFIPPLLAIEAWPWLRRKISDLARRMRGKVETLADQMVARKINFDSQVPGDAERILKLTILNGIQTRLGAAGLHSGIDAAPGLPRAVRICRPGGDLPQGPAPAGAAALQSPGPRALLPQDHSIHSDCARRRRGARLREAFSPGPASGSKSDASRSGWRASMHSTWPSRPS